MTDYQNAQYRMFKAELGVAKNHSGAYKSIPALVTAFSELEAFIQKLAPVAPGQQVPTVEGVSLVKQSTRTTLAQRAADVAALLHAHGDTVADLALRAESDHTEKSLFRKSDSGILQVSKRLHTLAKLHESALIAQGLEADELTKLNESIELFDSEMGSPTTAIAETSASRKARKALFKETMALFRNRLDKLMARFKTRDVDFYHAYQTARQVINTAKRYEDPAPPTAA